ncbi:hypothetical protein [Haloferula sargassicola]|uniref:Uncharacterized protein n=1 Tax=Haloferula sargassicola TaxID=490096 RepID=A0ABP9UU35_9BACT
MNRPTPWPEGVPQDIAHQHRSWKLQRIGRALIVAGIVAAVCGLFGPGLFSRGLAGEKTDLVRAEYFRCVHMQTSNSLHLHVGANAARGGVVRVWIDRRFMERHLIGRITPEPARASVNADRITYDFEVTEPFDGCSMTFDLKPHRPGVLHGSAGTRDHRVRWTQWVYP